MSAERKSDIGSVSGSVGKAEEGAGGTVGAGADGGATDQGSEELRFISEEISRELAPRLEHTSLVLYDRDPQYLQAQWYVRPEELARGRSLFPGDGTGLHQVLRLCRLDPDGRSEVVASSRQGSGESPGQGEDGFALHGDGAEYECELGLESNEGGWLLLVRSNRIRSEDRDLALTTVRPQVQGIQSQSPSSVHAGSSSTFETEDVPVEAALAAIGEPLYPVFPSLEPEDLSPTRRSASLDEVAGRAQPDGRERASRSRVLEFPAPLRKTTAGADSPPGADLMPMPPPLLPSSPTSGSPAQEMPGVLYDPRAALSSAVLPGVRALKSDIEVQAELIVQGRAAPGSTVDLYGHRVPVGEDGRFYIRRPIDDPLLLSLAIGGGQPPQRRDLGSE